MYIELNSFLGFTDKIKEPRKTKVEDQLLKRIANNGKVYNVVTFLVNGILEGRKPDKDDNYTYWSNKINDYTKSKTLYMFLTVDGNCYMEINKTYYDFCVYCINNGFVSEDIINTYIAKENERKEALLKEEEKEKQLAEEKERIQREEIEKVKQMIQKEVQELPKKEIELMESIFNSILGSADCGKLNYTLLALIHNFDNEICKEEIISRLHNDNKASIKTFECITGLKLPTSYKERKEYLQSITSADFKGMTEYKPRKKAEYKDIRKEIFYINVYVDKNVFEWQKREAEPINKYGLHMFLFIENGQFKLSHAESGMKIFEGKSKTDCLNKLKQYIEDVGIEKLKELAEKAIERSESSSGKNPRYATA